MHCVVVDSMRHVSSELSALYKQRAAVFGKCDDEAKSAFNAKILTQLKTELLAFNPATEPFWWQLTDKRSSKTKRIVYGAAVPRLIRSDTLEISVGAAVFKDAVDHPKLTPVTRGRLQQTAFNRLNQRPLVFCMTMVSTNSLHDGAKEAHQRILEEIRARVLVTEGAGRLFSVRVKGDTHVDGVRTPRRKTPLATSVDVNNFCADWMFQ